MLLTECALHAMSWQESRQPEDISKEYFYLPLGTFQWTTFDLHQLFSYCQSEESLGVGPSCEGVTGSRVHDCNQIHPNCPIPLPLSLPWSSSITDLPATVDILWADVMRGQSLGLCTSDSGPQNSRALMAAVAWALRWQITRCVCVWYKYYQSININL